MKKFYSKIDIWLAFPLIFPFFKAIEGMIKGHWYGYLLFIVLIIVVVAISKTTNYTISENELVVKSMWIVNEKIDIHKITKIENSNSIISSPALSLSRIKIKYNKYDEILISPKQKMEFASALKQINSNILVNV